MYIADSSVVTPVGDSLLMVSAAVDSGMSVLGETSFTNNRDYAIKGACTPPNVLAPLPETVCGYSGRVRRMLQMALAALKPLKPALDAQGPIPFLLAGPEPLPSTDSRAVGPGFFRKLYELAELDLDTKHCRYLAVGRTGGLELLVAAQNILSQQGCDTLLLGAVDTFLDPAVLSILDADERLMAVNRKAGFFPGEAAIFVLLTRDPVKAKLRAKLLSPAIAAEKAHLYSSMPCLGEAYTDVCKAIFAGYQGSPIQHLWTTVNGESRTIKEVGLVLARFGKFFSEDYQHHHPAECYGDCGAASGLLLMALAAQLYENSMQCGTSLILTASDRANRAGILVQHLG